MDFKNSYSPLDKSEIEAFEKKIGHVLPEEYKTFLMEHNGGQPEPSYFCYQEKIFDQVIQNCNRVRVFLAIADGEAYELRWTLDTFKHRIPINFLPIAENGTGSLICISLYGEDKGGIYFWDAELEEEIEAGKLPDYYNAFWVANNFNDFLNGLFEE